MAHGCFAPRSSSPAQLRRAADGGAGGYESSLPAAYGCAYVYIRGYMCCLAPVQPMLGCSVSGPVRSAMLIYMPSIAGLLHVTGVLQPAAETH
ncbi:hypothetical protein BM1_09104 [Bipolaris maydis]|nr:hypothetical protein BM1_09104 [Bipolaris maydis]